MTEIRPLRAYAEVALGRQRSPAHDSGPHMVPYLRAANVKDGRLDLTDVKEMNFTPDEQRVFALRPGDVLVTEGSGSLGSVGASAVWNGEISGTVCFQNTLLRLRPRPMTDARFLGWWCRHAFADGVFASVAVGANIYHVSAERIRSLLVTRLDLRQQQAIAEFLDVETTQIDDLIAKKRAMIALLEERVENRICRSIAESGLVNPAATARSILVKWALEKNDRPPLPDSEMVTAYRDGQVTARSLRRAAGYTESWTETARLQGVHESDIVIHGLDGFAGSIGTSEVDGVCSPIYHVCTPRAGADSTYLGRMLRLLAKSGYLGLFASSTRERAVDFRNWDLFGRIPIPDVEPDEQAEVGMDIREIAPLKLLVERSAALASERRQALITAAVTGELEILEAAA